MGTVQPGTVEMEALWSFDFVEAVIHGGGVCVCVCVCVGGGFEDWVQLGRWRDRERKKTRGGWREPGDSGSILTHHNTSR